MSECKRCKELEDALRAARRAMMHPSGDQQHWKSILECDALEASRIALQGEVEEGEDEQV